MELDRRFLIKNKAKYVDGAWCWGEEADFGPESDYAIYLGDNSYVAARKLLTLLEMKKDNEKDDTE